MFHGMGAGRPRKKIDKALVEKLAAIHCTIEEIAGICECSRDTIERRYKNLIAMHKAQGKGRLRRLQWEAAQKGNTGMMIWLGKQILNQRDVMDIEEKVESTVKVVYESTWGGTGESTAGGMRDDGDDPT